MKHLKFEIETSYLIDRIKLTTKYESEPSSYLLGEIQNYLEGDFIKFKHYVDLTSLIEEALLTKDWSRVRKSVNL